MQSWEDGTDVPASAPSYKVIANILMATAPQLRYIRIALYVMFTVKMELGGFLWGE